MGRPTFLLLVFACLLNAAGAPDYIPLQKGHYWIYKANVQWIESNPQTGKNEMLAKTLNWRSEILDVVHLGPGCTVALVQGWPEDLDWYKSNTQPSERLLLRIGTDYYRITKDAHALFDQLKQANGNLSAVREQLDAAEAYLPSPLTLNKAFGGSIPNQVDRRYCWVVENATPFDLASVKSAPPIEDPTDYTITYRSSPDVGQLEVVPGLGIVHHGYHHNGTKMEVDATLIESGPAPVRPVPPVKPEEPTIP